MLLECPNRDGLLEVCSVSKAVRVGRALLLSCVVTLTNWISSLEAFLATDCISEWCKCLAPIGSNNFGL